MSVYRQIHTRTWADAWFLDLLPEEKLLFIYLFSNEHAALCGLYELPLKTMAFETGLRTDAITLTLDRFGKAGKVLYAPPYIWVPNLRKYNENGSPKVAAMIRAQLADIPDCDLKRRYLAGDLPSGQEPPKVILPENAIHSTILKRRAADHARREDKRSVDFGVDDWIAIANAFGNVCAYCGSSGPLVQDHFVPFSRGGHYERGNIVPACPKCNSKKNAQMPEEYLGPARYAEIVAVLSLFATGIPYPEKNANRASNSNSSSSKTADKGRRPRGAHPETHPAIVVFREEAGLYPKKGTQPDIENAVGREDAALILWRRIVHEWVARGFKPLNVAGMLEWFKAGDVPPSRKNGGAAEPKGFAAIREYDRMTNRGN